MTRRPDGMSDAARQRMVDAIFAIPLHREIGLEPVSLDDRGAVARFRSRASTRADAAHLHGGVLNMVLEVPAYLALVPHLAAGEVAATVDVHISLMRMVPLDVDVELRGRLVRRGRTLAFCDADAWAEGVLCASARITKAILAAES